MIYFAMTGYGEETWNSYYNPQIWQITKKDFEKVEKPDSNITKYCVNDSVISQNELFQNYENDTEKAS